MSQPQMSQSQQQQSGQQHYSPFTQESLSNNEIYWVFKQRGFNIDSEKSLTEPTSEFFNNILVFSASLLLKIPLEEITSSVLCEFIESEVENCSKTLHCFQKMKYIRQMLDLVGIDDISSSDIIRPDRKKVKRTLVGIAQYIGHQEGVIKTHLEILERNRGDEQRIKRLTEELESLRFHSDQLRERKEAEKNVFKEKMSTLEKLGFELNDLLKEKASKQKEKHELKERRVALEKAIFQAEEDIKKMTESNQREKAKIVKSPLKLKDQCLQLQMEIEQSQKDLSSVKKEVQFISLKRSLNDILLQKIRKHLTLPSLTLAETMANDCEASKILKAKKNEFKELVSKEEKSQSTYTRIVETNNDLSLQIDQKSKLAEEKKKTYEEEQQNMQKEQLKLKDTILEIQQTIQEISIMKKNLESNAHEQNKSHEHFMREKKRTFEDIIEGLKEYKKNVFLMLDQQGNDI